MHWSRPIASRRWPSLPRPDFRLAEPVDRVELGRLGRAIGLAGWLGVDSWSEPREALFSHRSWWLRSPSGTLPGPVEWLEWRAQGRNLQVLLHGVGNRDDAARLTGALVEVPRGELPALAAGEYYRADLIGCSVVNLEGAELGVVDHFVDAPGNAVMVVRDSATPGPGGGPRERWLPVTRQHLRRVDLAARRAWVDWPEDF